VVADGEPLEITKALATAQDGENDHQQHPPLLRGNASAPIATHRHAVMAWGTGSDPSQRQGSPSGCQGGEASSPRELRKCQAVRRAPVNTEWPPGEG
jgi:hypothetical protein